jgi:hypothetical protein
VASVPRQQGCIHTRTRGRDKAKRCTCTSRMKVAAVQGTVSVGLD